MIEGPPRPNPRRVIATVLTVLAGGLVLIGLIAPDQIGTVTPVAFARIPVEGLIGVALLLVLPGRARRIAALIGGAALGLLIILKIVDIGFSAVLARPFNPVVDWSLIGNGMDFLTSSIGEAGTIAAAVGAVLLAAVIVALTIVAVRRLTRLAVRCRSISTRAVLVLTALWITCALLGAQLVPGVAVASSSASEVVYERALQVGASLHDRQAFAAQIAADPFRATPGSELLTGLHGKDVVLAFVESYGRSAVADPEFAPQVGAVLDAGTARLAAAGFSARSAFLTSSTAGGSSWLAHATLLSGLWIDNQQRYDALVASDRLTLTSAFRKADRRTVAVMPGTTEAWSEAGFFGYDQVHDFPSLGYRGPDLGWASVPDQYTLAAFERSEHAQRDRATLFAEIALVSSHAPWPLIPPVIGWNDVGDGSVYAGLAPKGVSRDAVWSTGTTNIRAEYRRSIEYSLNSLISYVETYGDDNLVLVFLGDHQPAPLITGEGASRDVPITIVARDKGVLDRIADWGWSDGLKPGPGSPVWPMDGFRDRFLTAFAS